MPSIPHAQEDLMDSASDSVSISPWLCDFLDRYLLDASIYTAWKLSSPE